MFRTTFPAPGLCLVLATVASALAEDKPKAAKHAAIVATDIAAAGPDFAVQGEYVGEIKRR